MRSVSAIVGARFEARRLVVANNLDVAASVVGAGTSALLEDAVVRDTQARESDGRFGFGIDVEEGGRIEASRLLVSNSGGVGVYAGHAGTDVALTDAIVRDTRFHLADGTGPSRWL